MEIDYSAALALRHAIETCRSRGIEFAVARLESLRAQEAFERFGVIGALGPGRLFHSVDEANRALKSSFRSGRVMGRAAVKLKPMRRWVTTRIGTAS